MARWNEQLRGARARRGLTQGQLAEAAGLSMPTVARYERGSVTPTRETLLRLGHALQLASGTLNALVADARLEAPASLRGYGTLAGLQEVMNTYPWPCLLLNERTEIVAWNAPAVRVAELDFGSMLPHQRNLMRIAIMQHFVERVVNWPEVIGLMVNMFAGNQYDFFRPDKDPLYFQAIVEDAVKVDGAHLTALMQLWMTTPTRDEEARTTLPVVWRLSSGQELRFNCVIAAANRFLGANQFDWFPADGQTWEFLGSPDLRASTTGGLDADQDAGNVQQKTTAPLLHTAGLMRQARQSTGLTQRELALRSGMSLHTVVSLERGRRTLTEAAARALIDAMQLDGVSTNELRLSAGLEPEVSDLARFAAGLPQRHQYFRFPGEARTQRARAHLTERIAVHPWPCLVLNERGQVQAMNRPLEVLLPGGATGTVAVGEELFRFLLAPGVRAWLTNWDKVAGALLAGLLREPVTEKSRGADGPFLVHMVDELLRQDPAVAVVAQHLAETLSVAAPSEREVFPVLLEHNGRALSFIGTLARWTDFDSLWVFDWHPADAATCVEFSVAQT